jgi:hypothetical protein
MISIPVFVSYVIKKKKVSRSSSTRFRGDYNGIIGTYEADFINGINIICIISSRSGLERAQQHAPATDMINPVKGFEVLPRAAILFRQNPKLTDKLTRAKTQI